VYLLHFRHIPVREIAHSGVDFHVRSSTMVLQRTTIHWAVVGHRDDFRHSLTSAKKRVPKHPFMKANIAAMQIRKRG